MQTNRVDNNGFDKRFSFSLVLTLLLQIGVGVWWVSSLNSRVSQLESNSDRFTARSSINADEMTGVKERILKLEINLQNIDNKLDEIKDLLKKR